MKKNIYADAALKEVPRLLTLLDRDANSPTYGCFDRKYWKYRIIDYSNARFQEAAYTLALLYSRNYPGNRWYKREEIRDYSIAAMRFWAEKQLKDGSFNEYMPHEHSHVATAFSLYAIASAYLLLGLDDQEIMNAIRKAAAWLDKNQDLHVLNHDAGSVAAIYRVYQLTKDSSYLEMCRNRLDTVLKHQHREGWFPEYGGADIGYQSFSLYYLAVYYMASGDEKITENLSRAIDFFRYFVHPDGTIGGIYGSRENCYIIPTGFEILSKESQHACSISKVIRDSLSKMRIAGPYSFDDRFVADSLYVYLEAHDSSGGSARDCGAARLPCQDGDFTRYFDGCGLYVRKAAGMYSVFNTNRGGICRISSRTWLAYQDSGWVSRRGDRLMTSNGPSSADISGDGFVLRGRIYSVRPRYQTTSTIGALRFLNAAGLHGAVKGLLRKNLILNLRSSGMVFNRRVVFSKNDIRIEDSVEPPEMGDAILSKDFSCIYSTTSGLFVEEGGMSQRHINLPPEGRMRIIIDTRGARIG